jgi:hypothetical protein
MDLRCERPATTAWATAPPSYQEIHFEPEGIHYVSNNNNNNKTEREREKQYTYNVTPKRVRTTFVSEKSTKYCIFWVCVCSLRYPGCNAPYWHVVCQALQYFPTLSHKHHNSRKRLLNIKSVFRFSLNLVWNIFHSKKKLARYYRKCVLVFIYRTHYSRQILMKLEFSRQFPKIRTYQISWKFVQWEPSCSMRKDRHDEANSRFSQFCKRAQ